MALKIRSPFYTEKAISNSNKSKSFNSNFFLGSTVAQWVNLAQQSQLANTFATNPVVYSVISLYANLLTNGKVVIKDLKNNQLITKENLIDNTKDIRDIELVKKMFRLIDNPNPLQSSKEFFGTGSIMKNVFGNEFVYGNSGVDRVDIKTVETLWNMYPQYMGVQLAGEYFNATTKDEIIKKWLWGCNSISSLEFNPNEILQRKDVNININQADDLIFGTSKLVAQKYPISNIEKAYESENVVLQNRGARLLISLARQQDQVGGVEPADKDDLEEVQKDWKEYGLLEDQKQAFITRQPLDVTVIDQDIRKLGIFETIANDSMSINNAYGIAHDLLKLWIQGSTFENQSEAELRTYQDSIIPEYNDKINDINQWLNPMAYGFIYVPTFEHVRVLQENEKEKATTNNLNVKAALEEYKENLITWNQYLIQTGKPPVEKGDKYRYERNLNSDGNGETNSEEN